jgi:hypothetical protein
MTQIGQLDVCIGELMSWPCGVAETDALFMMSMSCWQLIFHRMMQGGVATTFTHPCVVVA